MKTGLSWILVIAATLSMLCGCTAPQVSTPDSTQTQGSTAPVPSSASPGNSLIEYDPDREVYIYCGNINSTCYFEEYNCLLNFLIVSKKQVATESIRVEIQSRNSYEIVRLTEIKDLRDTQYNVNSSGNTLDQNHLPYYVFQNYYGTDFTLLAKLWELTQNPPEAGSEEEKEAEKLTGGKDPAQLLRELKNAAQSSYTSLKSDDVREFYVYSVTIQFTGETEETIEEMDVSIGNQCYHQEIGSLHLIPGAAPKNYPFVDEVYMDSLPMQSWAVNLYGEGYGNFWAFTFQATDDITLTDFYFLDTISEVLNIEMKVTADGQTITSSWDGKSPVYLYTGDEVTLTVAMRNPNMAGLHFDTNLYYELDMVVNGETYCLTNYVQMTSLFMNYHELYAIVFDGLDMEAYYRDYYYPIYEPWREEYTH